MHLRPAASMLFVRTPLNMHARGSPEHNPPGCMRLSKHCSKCGNVNGSIFAALGA